MAADIDKIVSYLRTLPPYSGMTVEECRSAYDKAELAYPLAADIASAPLDGLPGAVLTPPNARGDTAILYLHGGGYAIGSARSHRHLAADIARAAGMPATLPDYRLAPEHPYPAALDDAIAAYRGLLQRGIAPGRIVIGGDSAGGGLTVATMLAARAQGLPLPAAGLLLSPWLDLAGTGASLETLKARDPLVTAEDLHRWAKAYAGARDLRDPLLSPLYADLKGLPPLLVHVGGDEVLLDDSLRFARAAIAAGVEAHLEVWPGMIHVWPWFARRLSEGREAIQRLGNYARAKVA
jgi:phosphinothricin tripeptide acetyl hydrolase